MINKSEILKTANTGDILLFKTKKVMSKVQRFLTQSRYGIFTRSIKKRSYCNIGKGF